MALPLFLPALLLLSCLGLPARTQAQTQPAPFPRNAAFTGTTTDGFTLGGAAYLTAVGSSPTGGAPMDAAGAGVLRLTSAATYQTGYAIDNTTFSATTGFSIAFEFFSYGTTSYQPADGFSVFLVDGAGTTPGEGFAIGGAGGSLGYAFRSQTNASTTEPGVTKGYLGIGIDEFGNYGIPSEKKIGGYPGTDATTLLPNAVSLRGPYNSADPTRTSGYEYLASSGTLPFNLAVGTTDSNPGSRVTNSTDTGYRKAYLNVIPVTSNGANVYRITVRIQTGQTVTTAIRDVTVVNPPSTLRIGFCAATGNYTSIHEIRNLSVVQAPIAIDDNARTPYNRPVVIHVLDNDKNGNGSAIDPNTVDLDPNTVTRETTYSVPGQGTFTVDNQGIITFRPTGTFAGTVLLPYTVQNQNQDVSNLAQISVVVTGADVATQVLGPATIPPGEVGTFTVKTTNNGPEPTARVIPLLVLPIDFSIDGTPPAGTTATHNSDGTTTVRFAPTDALQEGQTVTNDLLVRVASSVPPRSNYTLGANYTYAPSDFVPDAVAANNASTLTGITGLPLPVQLTQFSAVTAGADVLLRWETAQEVGNQHFEVERSLNGSVFEHLATIASKDTIAISRTYRHTDVGASQLDGTRYYRLRQVDADGTSHMSPVRAVSFAPSTAFVSLYPNPASGTTTLDLRRLPAGAYTVQLLEATGRVLRQANYQPGQHLLPVGELPAGTYFVKVQGSHFATVIRLQCP